MRNFAKLALFLSSSFTAVFFTSLFVRFLSFWMETAALVGATAAEGEDWAELAWKSLPAAFYGAIIVGLNFSTRKKMPPLSSIFYTVLIISIFTGVFSLGINRAGFSLPSLNPARPVEAGAGMILPRSESAVILLRESRDSWGPRVVSFPGQPLIYQEVPIGPGNALIPLPPMLLGSELPWFIRNIGLDFNLSSEELRNRFEESLFSFAVYAFSIILFLSSMRFIFELSRWSLANIVCGALVFRGILALESFVNSGEIRSFAAGFLTEKTPEMMIIPFIFLSAGILVILYTALANLARSKLGRNNG